MFRQLADGLNYPKWADERWRRLYALDQLLDGKLFDHLRYSFYHEALEAGGRRVPLLQRRPSVRYNLPRFVAKQCARKLFAGRHAPRFAHQDQTVSAAATALWSEGFLDARILQAVVWGSVGSVAVTFKIIPGGEGIPRIVFDVWRARNCWPVFDPLGELSTLRLYYPALGSEFQRIGFVRDDKNREIDPAERYWFVRDYAIGAETTYAPRRLDDDDAEAIWTRTDLKTPEEPQDENGRQFVFTFEGGVAPAHWFVNLSGGEAPDGATTWEDAIDATIEIAYTLSQTGRGVRYNSQPQAVVIGEIKRAGLMSSEPDLARDSDTVIHLAAEEESPGGSRTGRGDAKLLEMSGNGVRAAMMYVEGVRKFALELIAASRKDPDRMRMPQSGKAMELLDEDFFDLVGELRTSYGDKGVLPVMRKAMRVAKAAGHPLMAKVSIDELDALALEWPKPYLPSSQEFLQWAQAIDLLRGTAQETSVPGGKLEQPADGASSAAKPGEKPGGAPRGEAKPGDPAKPKSGAEGDQPATPPIAQKKGIISDDEARALLEVFIDMPPKTATVAKYQRPIPEDNPAAATTPAASEEPGDDDDDDDSGNAPLQTAES